MNRRAGWCPSRPCGDGSAPSPPERRLDPRDEARAIDGLPHVVIRTAIHHFHFSRTRFGPREHNDRERRRGFRMAYPLEHFGTAHLRHVEIEHHQLDVGGALHLLEGLETVLRLRDSEAAL